MVREQVDDCSDFVVDVDPADPLVATSHDAAKAEPVERGELLENPALVAQDDPGTDDCDASLRRFGRYCCCFPCLAD
ncbi:MAG TPA: hypothetical protein VMY16_04195, partial [Ilumatobacteraceae bacterium]|nr:hypothetical protein [Ilumatobacteraceae bacterium]